MATEVLQVRVGRVEFPDICPVCAESADEITTVIFSEKTYLDATPYSGMLVSGIGGAGRYRCQQHTPGSGVRNTLRVPTCGNHKIQELGGFFKVIWFTITLVSFAPMLLLFYSTTNAIFMGRDIFPSLLGLVALVSVVLAINLVLFWPRPFQLYFKILDIIPNDIDILLQLKNPKYRDLFIELNAMHVSVINEKALAQLKQK